MKDEALNLYIRSILEETLENDIFEKHINIFSKFLSYTNPHYKYNGTYLDKYINDFVCFRNALLAKEKKYKEIIIGLLNDVDQNLDILIDQSFCCDATNIFHYVKIDKDKILSKSIEVKVKFDLDGISYVFCKDYSDFAETQLSMMICKDVNNYMVSKKTEVIHEVT